MYQVVEIVLVLWGAEYLNGIIADFGVGVPGETPGSSETAKGPRDKTPTWHKCWEKSM